MIVIAILITMYIIGLVLGLITVSAMWAENTVWQRVLGIIGCLLWFIVIAFAAVSKKK